VVPTPSPELVEFLLDCAPGAVFVFDATRELAGTNEAGRVLMGRTGYQVFAQAASRGVELVETTVGHFRLSFRALPDDALAVLVESVPHDDDDAVIRAAIKAWHPTVRQTQVLRALLEGLQNKEIAEMIGLSYRTVEVHVTALLEKAGVDSRARLIARARELVA